MKIGIAVATLVALVVAGIGLALAGGDDDSGGMQSASSGGGGSAVQTMDVTIEDFDFAPPAIEVTAGSEVSFTNEDSAVHTATSEEEGLFDSDDVEQGGPARTVTFDEAGTFAYFCIYHPTMKGEVVVK